MTTKPSITMKVRQLPPDDFSRPRVQNVETNEIYVDVNCGEGEFDWYTATPDLGEPDYPIDSNIQFELVK